MTARLTKREKARRARERRRANLIARILRNSIRDAASGCLIWQGRKNKGYGIITIRVAGAFEIPRPFYVHRVAWEVFRNRRIPKGRVAAHSYRCISALCCEWTHIRATTQSHNVRDQKRAKRWRERTLSRSTLLDPKGSSI